MKIELTPLEALQFLRNKNTLLRAMEKSGKNEREIFKTCEMIERVAEQIDRNILAEMTVGKFTERLNEYFKNEET